MEPEPTIGLQEAADRLGVHYMTAYRYVRTGRLDAERSGGEWRVDPAALDALQQGRPGGSARTARPSRAASRAATVRRLEDRLCANDEAGAWRLVEDALVAGAEPIDVLVDVISPAMARVGDRWEAGELTVADEHQATAIAHRVVGRLGPRFARRGRRRGTVAIGSPEGDHHALPVAIAADVVRGRGFDVAELGAQHTRGFVRRRSGCGRRPRRGRDHRDGGWSPRCGGGHGPRAPCRRGRRARRGRRLRRNGDARAARRRRPVRGRRRARAGVAGRGAGARRADRGMTRVRTAARSRRGRGGRCAASTRAA